MKKLLDINREMVSSGLHPSLPNQQVPIWKTGRNVVFQDLGVRPAAGQGNLFAKPSGLAGLGILERVFSGTRNLFWGTREALYRGIEGTIDPTDVSRLAGGAYTGDDGDLWSMTEFGNQIIATNGIDQPQLFLSAAADFDDFDNLTDLAAATAKIARKLGPFVLLFNTENDQKEMRWCDEDDVTTWTPTAANKARDEIIRDLDSEIMCVEPLLGGLGVYGKNQLFLVSFIGPPFFFGHTHLLDGVGAAGKASVVSVGRRHFGFGDDGIFITDGASFEYIDTPSIHNYVYVDTLDQRYVDRVVAWEDREETIVYFSVPSGDGVGTTVGYNYTRKLWSMHDYYRTAATSGAIWDNPIAVSASGQVLQQGIQGVAVQGEPEPITLRNRTKFVTGFGELGFGQGGFGGEWYDPGPTETDWNDG
jgi:hypothetical protein